MVSIHNITFIAQIVNLTILVLLLYRFLYKPLLKAIDAREASVAEKVSKAKALQTEAELRLAELDRRREEMDNERRALLQQAQADAETLRARLESEVRAGAAKTRARWEEDLRQERVMLETEMCNQIVENFNRFAHKALGELAGTSLEERIVAIAEERFKALPESDRIKGDHAVFTTAFPLEEKSKAALIKAAGVKNADFKTDPHIGCGVEMSSGGQILSWTTEAYVREFTDNLKTALDAVAVRLTAGDEEASADKE